MVPDPAPASDGDRELFRPLVDSLLSHDEYCRGIWRIDVKPWAEAEEGGV